MTLVYLPVIYHSHDASLVTASFSKTTELLQERRARRERLLLDWLNESYRYDSIIIK